LAASWQASKRGEAVTGAVMAAMRSALRVTNLCNVSVLKFSDFLAVGGVYDGDRSDRSHFTRQARSTGNALVANSEERLHAVLATLEKCQATLVVGGDRDTAQLLSVAILELRIKLNQIDDSELKALCDAMLREAETAEQPHLQKPHEAPRGRSSATLKLVK
jgi:hypothetical protein